MSEVDFSWMWKLVFYIKNMHLILQLKLDFERQVIRAHLIDALIYLMESWGFWS